MMNQHKEVLADVESLKSLKVNNKLKENIKSMLYTKSFTHMNAVCQEYLKQSGEPIHNLINKRFFKNKFVLINIVNYAINPVQYYVETLKRFTRKLTSDPDAVKIIILMRCEIDLLTIKNEFQRTTGKTLRDAIQVSTSGFYKYALYELIGEKRSDKR